MRLVRASIAVAVFAATLVVYLLTLYPGQGGGGDAAKFQYLGSVLGTAHPPGYPLYILVWYLFSHLPIGTLAYRINAMSACFGALATSLVFLILVRLKCHPAVAATAALALAFDRWFWSKSVGAEVYSLNAALVALVIWQALRWAESGRRRDLYLTAALLGLSLGNHLTSAMLAPALALFVLIPRPSEVRVRTTVTCVLLGALGLVQYGFILIRTWQHSPFAEAQASNLAELTRVVLASKYADEMLVFTGHQLLTERLPGFVRLFADDLGPLGVAFFLVGLVWAVVRRSRAAFLFVAGFIGVVLLTLNVDADVAGFLAPALVMAWLIAGLGIQAAWSRTRISERAGTTLAVLGLLALPAWQLARNYQMNDHHMRTYETRYMNALFARLEHRAAIVREVYSIDQLVLYKLAGEHAEGDRTIEMIDRNLNVISQYARGGYEIYAFDETRRALDGLGVRFAPVHLRDPAGSGDAIDMTPMPLYRLLAAAPCREVGNQGWRDITELTGTGAVALRIDNYRAFDAAATFYAGTDSPAPPVVAASQGFGAPNASVTTFRQDVPADAARLADALRRDGVPDAPVGAMGGISEPLAQFAGRPYVHRLELRVNDEGQLATELIGFGGVNPHPTLVRARVDLTDPRRATVCGWPGPVFFADDRHADLPLGADSDDVLFGSGWGPLEQLEGKVLGRWVAGHSATAALPLGRAGAIVVRVRATPSDDDHAHTIAIAVNGREFPAKPMASDWANYEWHAPAGTFAAGLNRVSVRIEGRDMPPDELSAFVTALSFDLVSDEEGQ